MSFYTGTQAELLYSLPAAVTNNSFTTQRVISAPGGSAGGPRCVIPAGFFGSVPGGVGRGLLIKGAGTVANAATGATFANALALDAVAGTLLAAGTIFSLPAIAPTASTTIPWDFEIMITCQAVASAGTTLQCHGIYRQSVAASSTALVATGLASMIATTLTTLANESQMFLELFSTCSASSASNTISVQQLDVFGLN
jgi:hypothetical protein